MGFEGPLWPVHPKRETVAGRPAFRSVAALPGPPDAAFIGVNRHATVEAVAALSRLGTGGAVCYASGFLEADDGGALQRALAAAAAEMPIVGPNCYGLINYLDGAPLWPDQHGGRRLGAGERGVAVVTQSSNIAVSITMQQRALPLAYVVTAGNQAQIGVSGLASAFLEDERVSAIGLHVEEFDSVAGFEALAREARARKVPVVVMKAGRSVRGRAAALTHTASVAGSDAGADAFLRRLGFPRVHGIPELLEALKLLHVHGALDGARLGAMCCSGGEAGVLADSAEDAATLTFPDLAPEHAAAVGATVHPLVTVANPFDYHTFSWGDEAALTEMFTAFARGGAGEDEGSAGSAGDGSMGAFESGSGDDPAKGRGEGAVGGCGEGRGGSPGEGPGFDATMLVLDFPRADRCDGADWWTAARAFGRAMDAVRSKGVIAATLGENVPEAAAARLIGRGIAPLAGLREALTAIECGAAVGAAWRVPSPAPVIGRECRPGEPVLLDEARSKARLAAFGVETPSGTVVRGEDEAAAAAESLGGTVAVKALGIAHKTERRAVRLGLRAPGEVRAAARELLAIGGGGVLVERFVPDLAAELIVGLHRDPRLGLLLTVGSGGTLVELTADTATLLLPATESEVRAALSGLRCAPILAGWRGHEPADVGAAVAAILGIASFAIANRDRIEELDVNPLGVRARGRGAVALDALIRTREDGAFT